MSDNTFSGDAPSPIGRGGHSPRDEFLLPSPIPTRRQRTYSTNERAKNTPELKGIVTEFCRERGHGFIKPNDGSDALFVHVSDIDGEYVPKEGDEVSYRRMLIPPKNQKYMAVHVNIIHLKQGVSHETWEEIAPKGTPAS